MAVFMIESQSPEYFRIHAQQNRDAGPAKKQICRCGKPADEWAAITAELTDFEALCRSCHRRQDHRAAHDRRQDHAFDAARTNRSDLSKGYYCRTCSQRRRRRS